MDKFLFFTIILLSGIIGFINLSLGLPGREIIVENQGSQIASLAPVHKFEPRDTEITLLAVGDIMLDRGVEYKIKKQGKGDFRFSFLKIAEELKKADIVFGNLEGPISDKGKKVGSIYSFRMNPKAIEGLIFAGFDVLSLANNHMFDYGKEALEDTFIRLKQADIEYVGAGFNEKEAFSFKIKEIKGTKIGFLAYTNLGPKIWKAAEENSGIAWIGEKDLDKVKKDIKKAKEKVDVLIVSLHSGEEYAANPTLFQISFATTTIGAGADLVIGHHPHVIQKIEKYPLLGEEGAGKQGWIAYSLGNFVFDQSFSKETMESALLRVVIENKKITKIIPQKIEISNSFQPFFAENYCLKDFETEKRGELIAKKQSFLEINLIEMKIKIYQQGFLTKEFSILATGDPDFWAGTPSGFYNVILKQKLAFSSTADVYMPWSINFYGKYYIHGQPYYSNGQETNFEYTGGCIRLTDNDAKALYDLTEKEMPVLVINKSFTFHEQRAGDSKMELIPGVSAKSYLVADIDSGFVFSAKNSQTQLPIASLTKLMTAIITAEQIDLRKSILAISKMLKPFEPFYWFSPRLEIGKRYRLVELFYPLLIESSNDAAEALGYFLGKNKTIQLMNEKSEAIGMESANFVDLSGLDKKNISTAQDIFYLIKYLINTRPPLLKIAKGEEVESFGEINFKDFNNKNIFFNEQNFLGGKSGYIIASQYTGCFLFRLIVEDIEKRVAIIILGSENLEKDTKQILKWFKENYSIPVSRW